MVQSDALYLLLTVRQNSDIKKSFKRKSAYNNVKKLYKEHNLRISGVLVPPVLARHTRGCGWWSETAGVGVLSLPPISCAVTLDTF